MKDTVFAFCSDKTINPGSLVDWNGELVPITREPFAPSDYIVLHKCRDGVARTEVRRIRP